MSEIIPKFPNRKNWSGEIWLISYCKVVNAAMTKHCRIKELSLLGLTFYTKECADRALCVMSAKAYVVEEINKANGGDNGFKRGDFNVAIAFNYVDKCLIPHDPWGLYVAESNLIIRDEKIAWSLIDNREFSVAYKEMLGL